MTGISQEPTSVQRKGNFRLQLGYMKNYNFNCSSSCFQMSFCQQENNFVANSFKNDEARTFNKYIQQHPAV